jgi:hypothetical protein
VWEILIFMQRDQIQPLGEVLSGGKVNEKFLMDDTDAVSPMGLLQESEKTMGGFRETLSHPSVVPPKGAKQIRAVGRKAIRDGYVELQWSYEISDDETATIAHYSKALKKDGFVLRNEKRKAQHVGMVFHRYPALVTLSLKPAAKKDKIWNVTVCENRPERSGDFLKNQTIKPNNNR